MASINDAVSEIQTCPHIQVKFAVVSCFSQNIPAIEPDNAGAWILTLTKDPHWHVFREWLIDPEYNIYLSCLNGLPVVFVQQCKYRLGKICLYVQEFANFWAFHDLCAHKALRKHFNKQFGNMQKNCRITMPTLIC